MQTTDNYLMNQKLHLIKNSLKNLMEKNSEYDQMIDVSWCYYWNQNKMMSV